MSKFLICALANDAIKYLRTSLITCKTLLMPLLVAASMGTVWGQCAGEVSTAANAASCTARSIPQRTVTSIDTTHSYSLAELIDIAEHNNPGTRVAWERAKQRADQLGIERSAYYPVLAGVATFAAFRTIVPVPKALVPAGYVTADVPLVQPEVTLAICSVRFRQAEGKSRRRNRADSGGGCEFHAGKSRCRISCGKCLLPVANCRGGLASCQGHVEDSADDARCC